MNRLLFAVAAIATLGACSKPDVATCTTNAQCPADAICVSGICQKGVPSGGAASPVSGSARLTAGTLTMDAVIGQPIAPAGGDSTRVLAPADNTR